MIDLYFFQQINRSISIDQIINHQSSIDKISVDFFSKTKN